MKSSVYNLQAPMNIPSITSIVSSTSLKILTKKIFIFLQKVVQFLHLPNHTCPPLPPMNVTTITFSLKMIPSRSSFVASSKVQLFVVKFPIVNSTKLFRVVVVVVWRGIISNLLSDSHNQTLTHNLNCNTTKSNIDLLYKTRTSPTPSSPSNHKIIHTLIEFFPTLIINNNNENKK